MGLYDRISEWPQCSINVLKRTIPDYKKSVILSQADDFKYRSKYYFTEKELLVISYNSRKKIFVAWNPQIHNHIHDASTIILTANYSNMVISDDEIKSIYMYRRNYGYEKIVFIGFAALHRFCANYNFYLSPHPDDEGFQSPALYITYTGELGTIDAENSISCIDNTIRSREHTSRLRRDPTFRSRILTKFNNQCIVCGCTEKRILEAAHIYDVQYCNDDSDDNGICLCANHHLLYDSGLLNFDWKNDTFSCSSESEQKMPWYIEAEKREFRLILPE